MAKKEVFYSFHFDNDVMRVQLIRNIGSIEENTPVSPNEWETIKSGGDAAVERWIDKTMKDKDCVVVLIGEETSNRKWVKEEIKKAWNSGKGLLGIYIHNLKCARNGTCSQGANPFDQFSLQGGKKLSDVAKCHNPKASDAYGDIKEHLEDWVAEAIKSRK